MVFGVGVRVDWVVVVRNCGVRCGLGRAGRAVVVAEDGFSRADVDGCGGDVLGAEDGGRFGVGVGGVSDEGRDLVAAEGAKEEVLFTHKLGGMGERTEFSELG